MTVKELRERLLRLDEGLDHYPVLVRVKGKRKETLADVKWVLDGILHTDKGEGVEIACLELS